MELLLSLSSGIAPRIETYPAYGYKPNEGGWETGIDSLCRPILVQKLELGSGMLERAETARIDFSGTAAGVGVTASSRRALSRCRDAVVRSCNQLAKPAFSAGSDAAWLGAQRTPERPGCKQTPGNWGRVSTIDSLSQMEP
jgi:hypothetical protein